MFVVFTCIFLTCIYSFTNCQCPPEYDAYKNETCFKVIYSRRYWVLYPHAVQRCESDSGVLASFDNEDQENWLVEKFLSDSSEFYTLWIGLKRNDSSPNDWYWIDSNPSSYRHWQPGEPNRAKNVSEDCVHIDFREVNGSRQHGWNDLVCGQRHIHGYICRAPYQLTTYTIPVITRPPGTRTTSESLFDYYEDDNDDSTRIIYTQTVYDATPETVTGQTTAKLDVQEDDDTNYSAIIGVSIFVGGVIFIAIALVINQYRRRNLESYSMRMSNIKR